MIDAYIAGGTNAQRVTIALEETGLAYQVKKLNFQAGDMKKPDYLKLNPTGRMPTIVDNDAKGGPFVLTDTQGRLRRDSEFRGRVMSIYSLIMFGGIPLGALWAGALAHFIGAPLTLLVSSLIALVFTMIFWIRVPELRRLT